MIILSTPFAGKEYCFEDYCRGIENLDWDKKDIYYIAIDNSNNKEFGAKIEKFINKMGFGEYKNCVYKEEPKTIESTDDYADVSEHCHNIYQILEDNLPDHPFTFNIEDDVEVPPDSLNKLMDVFDKYPKVGTAVGSCSSRRLKDRLVGHPVAWKFKEERIFPYPDVHMNQPPDCLRFTETPPFGIQIIGAAHMGCWLTKTKLIKSISFKDLHGLGANDIAWGYKLNKSGYYFVIDWSIKTKHYWMVNGEKGFYD